MAVIAVPILGLILLTIFDAIFRPTIRRLAFRNITRRRFEAGLVMLGSLLGTAIITAALIVGDTLGASFRDNARTQLGPIDEGVRIVGLSGAQPVLDALKSSPIPNVDGLLAATRAGVSVATLGEDPLAEPFAGITEVDFDEARAFGGDTGITGMANAGATPSGDEIVLTKNLAKKLEAKAGDTLHVYGFGHSLDLKVRQVLPAIGIAGFGRDGLFAAPGTIGRLLAAGGPGSGGAVGEAPSSVVFVSNTGGVFSGAEHTEAVTKELKARVGTMPGVEVQKIKQDTLDQADDISAQFTQLFSGIGSFSVIAGILLVVNIFVMLADERKSELGMLRAVGLKRNQLVRAFGMEGGVYALLSSIFGVIAGIGVGRLVAYIASIIFNKAGAFGGGGISLRFALEGPSLIGGFAVGFVISLLTVWGTSIRQGRLNVIRAIRDIAEAPASKQRRLRSRLVASGGIVVGLLLLQTGIKNDAWFGALAGVPLATVSAIPLLQAFMSRRIAVFLGCGSALVWGITVFTILPDALSSTEFGAFVVQGVILVGSAVAIVATNDDVAIWGVSKLGVSKRTLAARLGFAYPLAKVFRTSMLLGMYSIVIFTLTFLSVFSSLFAAQAPTFARDTAAGYDVLVDSNYSNPVPRQVILDQPGVVSIATIDVSYPLWETENTDEPERWSISGVDKDVLAQGTPKLNDRDPRFASDKAVWEAVISDPSLVILSNFFLQQGGPPEGGLDIGSVVQISNPVTRSTKPLTVVGKVDSDFIFSGPYVGREFVQSFLTDVTPSRHYVKLEPGIDADEFAERLTGKLITYGVDAMTFKARISEALEVQQGFMSLMQGYLGLGLVIGIAGLGVVMVRAVRERRRQIGMLRAMGFSGKLVRQAFMVEASFLAVQGIVLGTVLALVTSYNMLTNSSTFGGDSISFKVPYTNIAVVSAIALVASLAAATFPARQAAKIKPAVALRIAD